MLQCEARTINCIHATCQASQGATWVSTELATLVALLRSSPDAANAFGALASAASAVLSLVISVIALAASLFALSVQRTHNKLSVRPLPKVTVADFENSLRIKVRNNGSGPLLVNRLELSNGQMSKDALIDWMPPLPNGRPWTTYINSLAARALQPGYEVRLLELSSYEGESDFSDKGNLMRDALSQLTVYVHCTDIYGTKFAPYQKPLVWFGRNRR
jgi:hypothetical protein